MANRFTLYGHQLSGPTYKVGLMLSLCGEPFAYEHVDLRAGAHKQPDYLAKNRYGQVPCLHDGARHFCQSASILQYLAEVLKKFDGKNAEEHAHIREWMFWDFDRLAPGIFRSRAYKLGLRKGSQDVIDSFKSDGEAGLKVLEDHLGKHQWLVGGKPTVADIDCYGVIYYAADGGFDLAGYPNVAAWKKRVEALPGYGTPQTIMPMQSKAA
ncbi:MAG TPA: glutathione S-transferase family protein [Xanthobacteraceae bacterium]|nr:glutathione S-transferase family protein [Xanthobacteraceae bacterium]